MYCESNSGREKLRYLWEGVSRVFCVVCINIDTNLCVVFIDRSHTPDAFSCCFKQKERKKGEMGSSGFSWKLADHPKLPKGKTVAVVVLDGWGEAKPDQYNCIHVAETPTMDSLKKVFI